MGMMEKVNQSKSEKKPRKTTLTKIFDNFSYYRPEELIEKVSNESLSKHIDKVTSFTFINQIQNKYLEMIHELKATRMSKFIEFESEKILHFLSDLTEITTEIKNIPNEDQFVYLHSLRGARQLEIT